MATTEEEEEEEEEGGGAGRTATTATTTTTVAVLAQGCLSHDCCCDANSLQAGGLLLGLWRSASFSSWRRTVELLALQAAC